MKKDRSSADYRLYRIRAAIIQRCENPNTDRYKDYGGRGITICDEWRNSFESFKTWALDNGYKVTEPLSQQCTIDRIDNNKGYSPENCRFVNNKTQSNNKRSNRKYTYNGEEKTISQWAEYCGVPDYAMRDRLVKLHWSIERAVTEPFKCAQKTGGAVC